MDVREPFEQFRGTAVSERVRHVGVVEASAQKNLTEGLVIKIE